MALVENVENRVDLPLANTYFGLVFRPGSFPGHISDRCRCRDRNRNSELGQLRVSITTTTTAALTTTTKIATQGDTYSGVIVNQAVFFLESPYPRWYIQSILQTKLRHKPIRTPSYDI